MLTSLELGLTKWNGVCIDQDHLSDTIKEGIEKFIFRTYREAFHASPREFIWMCDDMEQIVPYIEVELAENFERDFRAFLQEWSQRC